MTLKWRKFATCLRGYTRRSTEEASPKLPSKIRNYFVCKTLVMALAYFFMGCQHTNLSICLPDMFERIHGNYASVSSAISLGSLCNIILLPLALLSSRFPNRCNLIMGIGCIMGGIAYVLLPYTFSMTTFGIVYFIIACSYQLQFGFISPGISAMWKDRAAFPLHVVSLGYAFGRAVAPLISKSFISPDVNVTRVNESFHLTEAANVSNSSTEDPARASYIEVPFAIFACFVVIVGLLFLLFDILERSCIPVPGSDVNDVRSRQQGLKATVSNALSPKSWASGNFKFGLLMAIGLSLYFACIRGHGSSVLIWGFSFIISSDLGFTREVAAYLVSVSNFFGLISLVLGTLCSYCIDINVMIFTELIGTAMCFALLSFCVTSQLSLWFYLCGYKLMSGSMWATGYAWINQYISFTVGLNCWVTLISCAIDIGTDNLVGYLLQRVSMISMMYFLLGLATLCLAVVIASQVFALKNGNRCKKQDCERKMSQHADSQVDNNECFISGTTVTDQRDDTHAQLREAHGERDSML